MFDPITLAGLGIGLIGGIGKMFGRGKANRRLEKLQAEDPVYTANPLASERLSLSKTLLNARAPGAAAAERNIYASGGNATANAEKYSTDSSQLLSQGAVIQGQQQQAFNELGLEETNDYQRRFGNYVGAQEGMINEQDKVFQDQTRRFGDKAQIQGAKNENNQNTWGDISNLGFGFAELGLTGGFKGMFGNNKGSNPVSQRATSWNQLQGYPNIDPRQGGASYPNRLPWQR